jgi:AcrR family transcriptional regulator
MARRGAVEKVPDSTWLRIQEVAVRLFAAKGFEATGIRDIADGAGVRTSALYHYMTSKEDLLVDIMVSILGKLIAAAREAEGEADSPPTRLVALVRTHVGIHAFERLRAIVGDDELRALSPDPRKQVIHLRDEYENLWAEVLNDGKSVGAFTFADAKLTRLALLEMCNGVARWYSESGVLPVEEVADRFAELALSLVDARRGRQRLRLADLKIPDAGVVMQIVQRTLQSEAGVRPNS